MSWISVPSEGTGLLLSRWTWKLFADFKKWPSSCLPSTPSRYKNEVRNAQQLPTETEHQVKGGFLVIKILWSGSSSEDWKHSNLTDEGKTFTDNRRKPGDGAGTHTGFRLVKRVPGTVSFARPSQSWHLLREPFPRHLHLKLALLLTGGERNTSWSRAATGGERLSLCACPPSTLSFRGA